MTNVTKQRWESFWGATMRGCTIAVAILLAFFAIMAMATSSAEQPAQVMTFSSLLTITLFSLVIAYAQEIFKLSAIPSPAAWVLNFLIVGIAFFFVILRSGTLVVTEASFYIVGMLLYTVVYGVVALANFLIRRFLTPRNKKDTKPQEEYVSRFQ